MYLTLCIIFNADALVARCYSDALRHQDKLHIGVAINARLSFNPFLCGKMVCGILKRFSKAFAFHSDTRIMKITNIHNYLII